MDSLFETYEKINVKISRLQARIGEYQSQILQIDNRRNGEIPARIENLTEHLKKIDEYRLKIEGFMKLAQQHMISRNVPTIEAPPGYRVSLNRLRNWSMLIDPMSEDDPYAQRVYLVSQCDLLFLSRKKEEFTNRISQLKQDLNQGSPEEIHELEQKITAAGEQLDDFIISEEMRAFAVRIHTENEGYFFSESPYRYSDVPRTPGFWAPGAMGLPLQAEEGRRGTLKKIFGAYYDDQNGRIYMPAERLRADTEFAMTISCVPAGKRVSEMDAGIRNLIFQMIHRSPAGSRKVYVLDALRQNSSLIGSLREMEGCFALHGIPRNNDQIQATLEELVSSFNDIDDVLENYDNVYEYNQSVEKEKRIVRSLVVLVGWPDAFEGSCSNYLKRIITGYERYGISFVLVKISARTDREENFGLSEYAGENIIHISMTAKDTAIKFGGEPPVSFLWYSFRHNLKEGYVNSLTACNSGRNVLGTEYIRRIDMERIPPYVRGKKNIVVPYGVDSRDRIHEMSFENENFAAYLMGASGSGKSTLLHTIITGIIRNYHPDDVELWLADFKMSEFAQYMDPLPPHVKYILLDESRELVYDLLDRLTEKMMERQRFFMRHKEMKKVENVPPHIYMPVIFVILDEFSIMSQSVSESETYKMKLQNLLAKGRALGIKFIFASQTYTKGVGGLTQTAKDQIQMRIAMKNSYEEIDNTLELRSGARTEQVRNWMEALPPHYALLKYRDGEHMNVKRLQVMYFAGEGEAALAPQRSMIRQLRNTMRKVSEKEFGSQETYVDKRPVVVDGNSFKAFDPARLSELRQGYTEERGSDIGDDLLISPGDPRRMAEGNFMVISRESRENMVLVARNAEQACGMSVIASVSEQFCRAGGKIHVWAYGRNRIYRGYKEVFFAGTDIREGAEEVWEAIEELREKIEKRETGKDLYILLGMEQICNDFDLLGESDMHKKTVLPADVSKFEVKTEEDRQLMERMQNEYGDLNAMLDEMLEEWIDQGKSNEEIDREIKRITKEYNALRHKGKEASWQKEKDLSENPENPEMEESREEQKKAFTPQNARADFQYAVSQGSRWGYHFMLCLNNVSDMSATGLKWMLFNHRLAFRLSDEDSGILFNARIAARLPEHICQYSNFLEQFSFRPYLHKGIEWDGWGIDENGNVINPGLL